MLDIALSIVLILCGVVLLLIAAWRDESGQIFPIMTLVSTIVGFGIILFILVLEPTSLEKCTEHCISYELVETVAENTDYTREEVTDFFIIVNDDMEAWDAIKLLDSSLTDEQINAIMEISAMKQEE
jgi:hypothetical protein